MSRRPDADVPPGLLLVDKPGGMTSHDVVARMRRLLRTRKVGHAGTLDPMATGVLVLGVGRSTRLLTYVVGADKTYLGTIRLGQDTVTDDAEGDVTSAAGASGVTETAVREMSIAITRATAAKTHQAVDVSMSIQPASRPTARAPTARPGRATGAPRRSSGCASTVRTCTTAAPAPCATA